MEKWINQNFKAEFQLLTAEEDLLEDLFAYYAKGTGYITTKDGHKLFQLLGYQSMPGDFYGKQISFYKFCQTIVLKRNSGQIKSKTVKDKGKNI